MRPKYSLIVSQAIFLIFLFYFEKQMYVSKFISTVTITWSCVVHIYINEKFINTAVGHWCTNPQ